MERVRRASVGIHTAAAGPGAYGFTQTVCVCAKTSGTVQIICQKRRITHHSRKQIEIRFRLYKGD